MSIKNLIIGICLFFSLITCDVTYNTTLLPFARDGISLIEARSSLYFVGGFEFNDLLGTDRIEVFDLVNRTWSKTLHMPSPRGLVTPVLIDPYIYFVGGFTSENPAFVFNSSNGNFDRLDQGPTVLSPMSISVHDSTLTVLGLYSVDFFDIANQRWNFSAELTEVTRNIIQNIFFSYEDIIVVIGGTKKVPSGSEVVLSAWIYNRTSDILEEFPNALNSSIAVATFSFSVTSRILSVWFSGSVILHRLNTQEWFQLPLYNTNITKIASTETATFIFTNSGFLSFNWTSNSTDLLSFNPQGFEYPIAVDGYVGYIENTQGSSLQLYDDASGSWIKLLDVPVDINQVQQSVNVGEYTCIVTQTVFYALNIRQNAQWYQESFVNISHLLASNDSCHFFDTTGGVNSTKRYQMKFPSATLLKLETARADVWPVAIVGNFFLSSNGYVAKNNWSAESVVRRQSNRYPIWASNDQYYAYTQPSSRFDPIILRRYYTQVDVYDLDNEIWLNSTQERELPFGTSTEFDLYHPAAALGDKLAVWKYENLGIYDPLNANWTTTYNGTLSPIAGLIGMHVHIPTVMLNDTAYRAPNSDRNVLVKFSAESPFDWTVTKALEDETDAVEFLQSFLIDGQIFLTSRKAYRFGTLYIYDPERDSFQISLLPPDILYLTMVPVGDFLVGFALNPTKIYYYQISNREWNNQDFNINIQPSAVYRTSTGLSVVVGGIFNDFPIYSNLMITMESDGVTAPPVALNSTQPTGEVSSSGLTQAELIVVIVVPIGAVLIAGAIVLIVLLQKRKNKKKRGGSGKNISMTGLATKYGQWFIPFDQIKFGDQVGSGGSGQVFKGSWKGTTVALKLSMTQANSTVIGELELMMQMRPHPNIVQLFGFSVHPETDSIILVIEFCDGGSLDDMLFDSNVVLSSDQKTTLMLGIAKGLNHLHSNNIVHRDVAARNVLLDKTEPKLTDFGMSRVIDANAQRGTTKSELGPIRWMAPESLKNKEYSAKSDVWSFGVLMYEIIVQEEPHTSADPIEIGRLIRDNGLTPVIPPSCPSDLAAIMRSCWSMNASKRPTIEQIIELLQSSHS